MTPLIPRAVLFGNPERGPCSVSPCGRWLAFAAPRDGVMNLWVCERTQGLVQARPITNDRLRGIDNFSWAFDGVHLVYSQDSNGDENFHLYAVPAAGGDARDLTPFPGSRGMLQSLSRKKPGAALVSINQRDPRFADLYQVELSSGELTLVQQNPGFGGFLTDEQFGVRLAQAPQTDGSQLLLLADGQDWKPFQHIPALDASTTKPLHLHSNGHTLYMLDSRGRDTAALVSFELTSEAGGAATVLAQHARADVLGVWSDLHSKEPLAWVTVVERREIHVLSEAIAQDVLHLDSLGLGEWSVGSRSDDEQWWILLVSSDTVPGSAYLYDRPNQQLHKLYDMQPRLATAPLARMQHTTLRSRDGLDLVSYLTLPVHADRTDAALSSHQALPLVLLVHGGPWTRDSWGYNGRHQWLANRGYAVLSVNFRASTGLGKRFTNAGDLEWGAKMDDDLCDAVDWAIAQGIADPHCVCIMGGSYGGYATLWGMATHPGRYACGVDIVGPSNLETLVASIPPQWEAARSTLHRQIGDPTTPEGLALLKDRSPVHRAQQIKKPLLIGQGAHDPRVKQAESDQMVAAMKAKGIPVTYVLFPDEGHGFHRPTNSIYFNAIVEQFLARYLGGRSEPLRAEEVEGHSGQILENSML
ncbi:MAG: S9 family peptidase [Ideonella sp.]|nr:S9 family peptidase [Ideonella sp.]